MRILNSELADTLGNLLSRGCAKSVNVQQIFPHLDTAYFHDNLMKLDVTKKLVELVAQLPGIYNFTFISILILSPLCSHIVPSILKSGFYFKSFVSVTFPYSFLIIKHYNLQKIHISIVIIYTRLPDPKIPSYILLFGSPFYKLNSNVNPYIYI